LPADIHERVKQLAIRKRRTFSGQLTVLVERALEAMDQEAGASR
jgi:hypothetical protein